MSTFSWNRRCRNEIVKTCTGPLLTTKMDNILDRQPVPMASEVFILGDVLDESGNTKVFRGKFRRSDVVIKRIQVDGRLDQLDREVNAMTLMDHPNVLKLLHWEDRADYRYLVLEQFASSLKDFISGKYYVPMRDETNWLKQLAKGLDHIHSRGFVHCDINPENVLVSDKVWTASMKISGFGSCQRSRNGLFTASGAFCGTSNYLAPEMQHLAIRNERMARDNKLTDAVDVFALGCVFFYLLTKGTHPFGSELEIVANTLSGKCDLSKLPSDHFAVNLISKMIGSDPQRRPTAADVVNDSALLPFGIATIGDVLGKGGYGVVHRGTFRMEFTNHVIPVAIKKVLLENGGQLEEKREEVAMSQLRHINVIHLLHISDDKDFRFYVLELCDGSLDDYFKGKYQGPMIEDADALNQMARGLRFIHMEKLIHRDIKPDNILISAKSADFVLLKISDFGLCKRTNDQGSMSLSGPRGTMKYMAPELLKLVDSEDVETPWRGSLVADVFSMGVVFFCFLAPDHKHPFDDGIPLAIPANIIRGNPDLRVVEDSVWCALIGKMLSSDPSARLNISVVCSEIQKRKPESPPGAGYKKRRCSDQNEMGDVDCCRFHPTKPKLACGLRDGRICLFSGESYTTPFAQWNKTIWQATTDEWIMCFDWKVDGSKLAAGYLNGTVIVWDEDGTKSFEMKEQSGPVRGIRWNKAEGGSHLFITWGEHKLGTATTIVWDSDKKVALKVSRFYLHLISDAVWISADQFASCRGKTIDIFRIDGDRSLKTFDHEDGVGSLQWNESDNRMAGCSFKSIKIWSLDEDEPLVTLRGGGSWILCFDWHRRIGAEGAGPVRWWIVGGCQNSDVLFWDLQVDGAATEPRRLTGHSLWVRAVAFSPDGEFLASADGSMEVIIWWTKKWETIFRVQWKKEIFDLQSLTLHFSGNRLAIANDSPEVVVVEFEK